MEIIPTIKLRKKDNEAGEAFSFNVEEAVELCKGDWEVVTPEGDEVQAKTIEDLENADQLEAEEKEGGKEVPETTDTDSLKVVEDKPETADDKPEIISPDVSVADESPEVE